MTELINSFSLFLHEHLIVGSMILTILFVFLFNLYLLPFRVKSILDEQREIKLILKKFRVESFAYYEKEHEDYLENLRKKIRENN